MKSKKNRQDAVEVLIAEDSPTQAQKLQGLLEEHGYAVVAAPNGKEALAAARRRKPAMIISDVLMPELDGYGLCQAIKADERLKDTPVILLTTLCDPQDVIRGLECGADNFIRKPFDERALLSRIENLLINLELRKSHKIQVGLEVNLGGHKHFITSERQQILDLLISTYEQAIHLNNELKLREKQLARSNQVLNGLYHIAEGLNRAASEKEVVETVLQRALEMPEVRAGWIFLREGESGYRLAAARNLPPEVAEPSVPSGLCWCQRRLTASQLETPTNIPECEWLQRAHTDIQGLRGHASVPIRVGEQVVGVINLVGSGDGLLSDEETHNLGALGNQLGIALARARLHEHLERLVEERTAKLAAEVEHRKCAQEEQARLVAILEATPDLVGTATPDGRLLYTNQAGRLMLGLQEGCDLSTLRIHEWHPEWAGKLVMEQAIPHAVKHGTWSGETALLRRDGREVPILQVVIAHQGPDGSVSYLSTIGRDITQRKEHEARIVRLNRIYSVLSGINTTIVRVRERQELFEEACRIAVDHGRFAFAWIGTLDADKQKIAPVAQAGRNDGYLSLIDLSVVENPPGPGEPTAQALTQGKPVICNDIAADDRTGAWRAEALNRGYRSVAILPLVLERQPVGVFALYAPEPGVFDEEEMRLLVEMAGDISFALDHLKKDEQLNYLAYFDAITDLPNRALFGDRLAQRIGTARRDRRAFSVIVLDLERFSVINETLGRQAGDELLRQVAQRLGASLDETDILARFSGDCFGIATGCGDEGPDIAHTLERALLSIRSQPFLIGGKQLRVAARAGVSSFPTDGEDAESLYRNAEAALKKAKLSKEEYLFYTPEINARVAERLTLENKLRRAVEEQQWVLQYQPKVDLKQGHISGLEALLRWNDPDVGLVPPLKFIPVLEETGMIFEAGRWALEKAMTDYRQWQARAMNPPRIAVNVSPIQLRQKDFVLTVKRALKNTEGTADCLELEITESVIMQDIEANIEKLRASREMGVQIAVDDFGTGYSSLSYITKLPVNALKIDRSFIVNMTHKPDDLSIVSTIISLAHSLNLRVVAEGVETEEQANLLRLLKCDEIQGYLVSPAVAAEQIERLLLDQRRLLAA
jgi:diguanylate cyclase (GGDEF)-like protein/PAS domain S-box-containing protein